MIEAIVKNRIGAMIYDQKAAIDIIELYHK